MPDKDPKASAEREQTDDSLRDEREFTDHALAERLQAIDAVADAVSSKARARIRADRLSADASGFRELGRSSTHGACELLTQERVANDRLLEAHAFADEALQAERGEARAQATSKRTETDDDLRSERVQADDTLAMRDEFIGVVSHDLRGMLQALTGHAELLSMEAPALGYSENALASLASIRQVGVRMERLIGDLVDIASISAGRLVLDREVLDPAPLVDEVAEAFRPLASAGGIALSVELIPPPCLGVFDPSRILQVLSNLVSNAIKFTPSGGRIQLRVEARDGELRFTVSDTGMGIAADKLERVFERFYQVDVHGHRGVGLGLHISRRLVEAHGGRLWAESVLGEGSSFIFTVPLSKQARA